MVFFTPPSVAIVTPSYWGDRQQCELLVRSLRETQVEFQHYLIVDRTDAPAFRPLAGAGTTIIEAESIIDPWLRRVPGTRGYWLSLRALPVRGWIMQQIKKIAITRVLPHDVFVMCDSDVAFIRKMSQANILKDGRVPLLDNGFQGGHSRAWTRTACELLGLKSPLPVRNHVGMMICWQRPHILGLQDRIEAVSCRPWQLAIARHLTVSEYMLYGAYVRGVVGYDLSGHVPIDEPPIRPSWGQDLHRPGALKQFFDDVAADEIGVMLHSKDRIDPDAIRRELERSWNAGQA